jgi:hypothetical protein
MTVFSRGIGRDLSPPRHIAPGMLRKNINASHMPATMADTRRRKSISTENASPRSAKTATNASDQSPKTTIISNIITSYYAQEAAMTA